MPTLIVEHLPNLWYDSIKTLYDMCDGNKLEFSEEAAKYKVIDSQLFYECLYRYSFEFYTWMCRNFIPNNYSHIYQLGLVKHIEFTEREMDDYRLQELCCSTSISDEITDSDLTDYVQWLIANGRARKLEVTVFMSIISEMITRSMYRNLSQITDFLATILMMSRRRAEACTKELLELACIHQLLFRLISESGMLTTDYGRRMILTTDGIPEAIKDELWKSSFNLSIDNVQGASVIAIKLLCNPDESYIETEQLMERTLQRVFVSDKKVEGNLQRYGALIIREVLARNTGEPRHEYRDYFVYKLLRGGYLLPSLFSRSMERSIHMLMEITRSIYRTSSIVLIRYYHGMITTVLRPEEVVYYDRAINYAIRDLFCNYVRRLDRHTILVEIICLVGDRIRLGYFTKLAKEWWSGELTGSILAEIERRGDPKLDYIADTCLGKLFERGYSSQDLEVVNKYPKFIGERTLHQLVRFSSQLNCSPEIEEKARDYADKNPRRCIEIVISNFSYNSLSEGRPIGNLIDRTQIRRAIWMSIKYLVLGGSLYRRRDIGMDFLLLIGQEVKTAGDMKCKRCRNVIVGTIYHSDGDAHGQYYCTSCRSADASATSCSICLSNIDSEVEDHKSLDMRILECGHVCCLGCLIRIPSRRDNNTVSCPVCLSPVFLLISETEVRVEEVAEKFYEEWIRDNNAAIMSCQKLVENLNYDEGEEEDEE